MHEYWALAVRHPQFRDHFAERQLALRDGLARALRARHETTGVPLTVAPERLATAFIALGNGLALDRLVDEEAVEEDLFGEIAALVYDGNRRRVEESNRSEVEPT